MSQFFHLLLAQALLMITWELFLKKQLLTKSEYEFNKEMMGERFLSAQSLFVCTFKISCFAGGYLFFKWLRI